MALLTVVMILGITSVLLGETFSEGVLLGETVEGYKINFPQFNLNTEGIDNLYVNNNNSGMSMNALQVTPDSSNKSPQFSLTNRSGRVLLKKKFRVYDRKGTVSFNTWFIFNIQNVSGNGGEGLAFIVTSTSYDYIPANSYGQWLGLFNASTNGHSSSQVLAVEFDTVKSRGTNDPDANHVGINVNDINSINFTSLHDQIYLNGSYDIQAWIQYDGITKNLSVYVAKYGAAKPPQPLVSSIIDLSNNTLGSEAYFGFSGSTGNGTELHCVKAWNFTFNTIESKGPFVMALSVCLPFALVGSSIGIILVVFLKCRKSKVESTINVCDALEKIPGRPREFRYRDLKKATNSFSPEAFLGRGGFGNVYKGILPEEKTVIAVKRMANESRKGKEEFISEIRVINRLSHRNLVPLLGWCHEKGKLMMVYECMPNGSLDKHIFNRDAAGEFLDSEQRYEIISGVASALLYLHEECEQKVIHRDVKASNIMLDSKYNARLGDFGLARLIEHDRRSFSATNVAGTDGYIAPECFLTGRATAESDVFSFGVVVLEVTCGKRPSFGDSEVEDLIGWVWKLYGENRVLEAADSRLATLGSVNFNEEDMRRLLMLGLVCSTPNPEERPTMREVTQILARTMPPPSVPQIRPDFTWFHLPLDISSTATPPTSNETETPGNLQ